jgi:hypothetical protein
MKCQHSWKQDFSDKILREGGRDYAYENMDNRAPDLSIGTSVDYKNHDKEVTGPLCESRHILQLVHGRGFRALGQGYVR